LGLTLELSAFAAAMYGWHPGAAPVQPVRQHLPALAKPEIVANVAANVAPHPVIDALIRAGRPLTNGELARMMNCCDGEATKRRREVSHVVNTRRAGRHVLVSL